MAQIHRTLWFRFLLLTLLSSMAAAQLVPSGDTYVTGASPTTANGSSTSLVVQGSSVGKPSYSFIRFDMAPLTGVTAPQIQNAYLRVYVTAVTAAGGFTVSEVTGPANWAEGTLTYSGGGSTVTGTQLGGTIAVPYPNGKSMYFDIDVTQAVKDWLTTPASNNGLVLKPADTSVSISLSSKEDSTFSQVPTITTVLVPNAGQILGQIGPSQVLAGTYAINVSGSAGTLASTTQCLSGYATGISLSGTAQCSTNGSALTALNPANIGNGTANINITGSAASAGTASNAVFATTAGSTASFTGPLVGDVTGFQTATVVSKIGGVAAANFARLDIGNLFNGDQSVSGGKLSSAASTNSYASLNIPVNGAGPTTPAKGDIWAITSDPHLNFRDMNGITQTLAFNSDITAANTTLQGNIDGETTARIAGDASTLSSSKSYTDAQVLSESVARAAGDTAAIVSAASYTDAQVAPINTSLTGKANLSGGNVFMLGKQTMAAAAAAFASLNIPSGNMPTSAAAGDVWLTSGDHHLQFQSVTGLESLAFTSDVSAANTTLQANIDAETAARIAGDASTLSSSKTYTDAQVLSESVARAAGDTAAIASAEGYTNTAVATINTTLTGKANLAGGNLFTGGSQALAGSATGYPSLNIPNGAAAPNAPVTGDIWLLSGNPHLQFQSMSGLESLAFTSDVSAANTTLQANIDAETTARIAGDASTLSSSKSYTDAQVLSESVARAAGDTAAIVSAASYTDAQVAPINTSLTGKANLSGGNVFMLGKQTMAAAAAAFASLNIPSGNMPTSAAAGDVWLTSGDHHLQFQSVTGLESLAFTSDVSAANTTLQANIDAETAARIAGDASTLSSSKTYTDAQVLSESVARAAGDTAAIASAEGYTNTAVATINTTLTGKANLAGGNLFTGGSQALAGSATGYPSLNIPNGAAAPNAPVTGDIWLLSGNPHLQFQSMSGLESLAFTSDVSAANTTLQANIDAETTARIAGDASTLSSSKSYTDAQVLSESVARAAGDTAAIASAETFSSNASNITSGTIGQAFLPNGLVYNNQANTYTAGSKQKVQASATTAGFAFGGVTADPSTLTNGDLWYRTDTKRIQFYNGTTTNPLATTAGALTLGHCASFDSNGNIVDNGACNSGTISNVIAGTDLTGGGSTGSVTLNLDTTKVPTLAAGNTFTGANSFTQTISANISGSATSAATATTAASAAAVPFSGVAASTNVGQALLVGNGSSLAPTGTGVVTANSVPASAGVAPTTSGQIAYNSTSNTYVVGVNGSTATLATTAANAAVAFIKDSSNGKLANAQTSWIGNNSAGDGAQTETQFEFLMGETVTYAKFYCQLSASAGANVTFQVFTSAGALVSGGSCVITAGQTSGSSTSNTIALTAGNLYAVKASLASGTFGGGAPSGWWALGQ